jgi:ElaA protein
MNLLYKAKPFEQLSVHELHDLLRLRTDIFVVEQACAYAEIDGRDPQCLHILGSTGQGDLVAYARIIPPHGDEPPHIGRVVVRADQRGQGHAHELMRFTLEQMEARHGSGRAALAAQSHLEKFYSEFGFVRCSEEYPWDGIPHVDMERAG